MLPRSYHAFPVTFGSASDESVNWILFRKLTVYRPLCGREARLASEDVEWPLRGSWLDFPGRAGRCSFIRTLYIRGYYGC